MAGKLDIQYYIAADRWISLFQQQRSTYLKQVLNAKIARDFAQQNYCFLWADTYQPELVERVGLRVAAASVAEGFGWKCFKFANESESEATDGEEAVRMVNELIPDITVMDVTMPVLNGTRPSSGHAD